MPHRCKSELVLLEFMVDPPAVAFCKSLLPLGRVLRYRASFVFGANTELPTPPRTPSQTSSSLFSQVTNVPCQITVPAGAFAGSTSSGTVAHKMVEHAQITTQNVIAGGLGEGGQFVQGRATSDSAQSHTTDFRLELDGFVC